jgi:hypothetical protein
MVQLRKIEGFRDNVSRFLQKEDSTKRWKIEGLGEIDKDDHTLYVIVKPMGCAQINDTCRVFISQRTLGGDYTEFREVALATQKVELFRDGGSYTVHTTYGSFHFPRQGDAIFTKTTASSKDLNRLGFSEQSIIKDWLDMKWVA